MGKAPLNSIQLILNGVDSSTLIFGSGGGSGYGLPFTRWHVTHAQTTELTICPIAGIQNFCRMYATVAFAPECLWCKWASRTISLVSWCFFGNRWGNFVVSSTRASLILPPQRM